LFLAFFGRSLLSCWRCRTTTETVGAFVLAFFFSQLVVYDTLNLPFVVVMLAIALVSREQLILGRVNATDHKATDAWLRLRRLGPFIALLAAGGAALGGAWSLTRPATYTASVSVMLEQVPVELNTATTDPYVDRSSRPKDTTVDTEAGLVVSRQTLRRVETRSATASDLRRSITVTAPPQTRILTISARAERPDRALRMARYVSSAYLTERRVYLAERRSEALAETERQVAVLVRGASFAAGSQTDGSPTTEETLAVLEGLQKKITALTVTPIDVGKVIDSSPARKVPNQRAVPLTSGAALGLALGTTVVLCRPGWTPRSLRRPRRAVGVRSRAWDG
jgi:hypothetical protein